MSNKKLPPEIEKIRDSVSKYFADLSIKNAYNSAFNDAFPLGREFERDELAKKSTEFDKNKFDKNIRNVSALGLMQHEQTARWQHRQTSLIYEVKIAKLEAEIERLKNEI